MRTVNSWMRKRRALPASAAVLAGVLMLVSAPVWAQLFGGPGHHMKHQSAEQAAPIDLTGYWQSIITQDWAYRMVVPQRGNYVGIPINLRARQYADAWKRSAAIAAGQQCQAYGAPILMRNPEHLHITWQNPETLKVQTDAGMQTRLLHFAPTMEQMHATPSLQGLSVAKWFPYESGPGFARAGRMMHGHPHFGYLQVHTTDMMPGLLRKNGVPYSARTSMTEQWVVDTEPDGAQWLVITTTVDDPTYLQVPYVMGDIFEKQPNGSQWDPSPCSLSHM